MRKGAHLSEKSKHKISLAKTGCKQTPESIQRRLESRKERIALHGYTEAELNKGKKISQSKKGSHWTEEQKKNFSKTRLGGKLKLTPEGRKRKVLAATGNSFASFRKDFSRSEETKRKIGVANAVNMKAKWQDDDYVAMQMKTRHCSPNKTEKRLTELIDANHFPFSYVGDGQFILGGKCPDYIHRGGKKQIIELFGAYWHNILDVGHRVEYFRQYGFSTLIIWEEELKNESKVLKKIKHFLTIG